MAGRTDRRRREKTGADAVLGPVRAVYSDAAPAGCGAAISTRRGRSGSVAKSAPATAATSCCAGHRRTLRAAASTSRSARPAARTPNISPIHEAGGRIAFAPAGAGRRAGSGQPRALLVAGEAPVPRRPDPWQAARPQAPGGTACFRQVGACLGQARLLLRGGGGAGRRCRSAATAMRCAASCTPASSPGCSACASPASMAPTAAGGAAMQPDVSFVIAAFNAEAIDRRAPSKARSTSAM